MNTSLRRSFTACAATVALSICVNVFALPARPAPPLRAPSGNVINVTTEAQLQAAMQNLTSNTTIVIAPGTYYLSNTLWINRAVSDIGIRGASGDADDVVLVGRGMTQADYGSVPHGIWTGGGVSRITIADLTIRDFYYHPIIFNAGTQAPFIHNVHLVDAGQQFVKVNPDPAGGGANNGVLEYSIIEFTTTARDDYPKGIDIHNAINWSIRHNLFRNLIAPGGGLAGPAILAWAGTSGTVSEGNTFLNCSRGVMYGGEDAAGVSHRGGVIRNNFFYRLPSQPGDAGILVFDSPETRVVNNTVVLSGTYANAIEYRYGDTTDVFIANNLHDGLIRARDGATATVTNNVGQAAASMFVDASSGDLHLGSSAAAAIDHGTTLPDVTMDWDGDARPAGAYDVGADEFKASLPAPTPPTPRGS